MNLLARIRVEYLKRNTNRIMRWYSFYEPQLRYPWFNSTYALTSLDEIIGPCINTEWPKNKRRW